MIPQTPWRIPPRFQGSTWLRGPVGTWGLGGVKCFFNCFLILGGGGLFWCSVTSWLGKGPPSLPAATPQTPQNLGPFPLLGCLGVCTILRSQAWQGPGAARVRSQCASSVSSCCFHRIVKGFERI